MTGRHQTLTNLNEETMLADSRRRKPLARLLRSFRKHPGRNLDFFKPFAEPLEDPSAFSSTGA